LRTTLLGTVDPIASLSGITITGGRLNVNAAILSCMTPPAWQEMIARPGTP
jgi:hypothetical protein